MKGNQILLIADGDSQSEYVISRVAKQTDRELRRTNTSADAFRALGTELSDVDAVIVDLDSGIQALLILEILSRNYASPQMGATGTLNHPELRSIAGKHPSPPIIAITTLDDPELPSLACKHGATACLHKPLDAVSLTNVIEHGVPPMDRISCDLWGHPASFTPIARGVRGRSGASAAKIG